MSKKQHRKQLERARQKRRASKYDRRAARNRVVIIVMAALMVLSLVAVALTALVGGDDTPEIADAPDDAPDDEPTEDELPEQTEGPCPSAEDQDVPEPAGTEYDEPPRYDVEEDATYVVTLETTCGDIEVELDTDGAPRTAENFLALADDGFYAGVPFHRTIEGFMIQGGDPTGTGAGGPGYELEDELGPAEELDPYELTEEELESLGDDVDTDAIREQFEGMVVYPRGTLAMANSGPDTQGSQFFIVHQDSPLPPDYTVFGEVVEGMDVVDDIAAGPVSGDQAIDPVHVTEATIEQR